VLCSIFYLQDNISTTKVLIEPKITFLLVATFLIYEIIPSMFPSMDFLFLDITYLNTYYVCIIRGSIRKNQSLIRNNSSIMRQVSGN